MADEESNKTIMVVDDEYEIRESLYKTLTRENYNVMLAESGPECIELLKTAHPDIILLDIFMNPWDGWKTLDKIKGNPETMDIPVSMLTVVPLTVEDFEDKPIERSKFIFLENYLVKPVNREELLRAVRDIIEMDEHLKTAIDTLKDSEEAEMAKEFERVARNLHRNRKLKQSLIRCLVDEAKDMERVRKVIELQERNIDLSLKQIRALENKYRKYGVTGWKTKEKEE